MIYCPHSTLFETPLCDVVCFARACQFECLRSESESGSDVDGKTASTETGAVFMVVAGAERSQ